MYIHTYIRMYLYVHMHEHVRMYIHRYVDNISICIASYSSALCTDPDISKESGWY